MKQELEKLDTMERRQFRRERLRKRKARRKKIWNRVKLVVLCILFLFLVRNVLIVTGLLIPETMTHTTFKTIWNANSKKVVMIDAGHGGSDSGTVEAEIPEKDLNLQIALHLKEGLEKKGIKVLMTRSDDSTVSLDSRVARANQEKPDLYVSIHQNSFEDASVRGIEFWYNDNKTIGAEESRIAAQKIEKAVVSDSSMVSRGIVPNLDLQVLRQTEVPAVLIEIGYVTNIEDRNLVYSQQYREKISKYIMQGALDFLSEMEERELI